MLTSPFVRMKKRIRHAHVITSLVIVAVFALGGCGDDNGDGKTEFGRVEGTVYLPFDLAAALQPAAGVTVLLSGGDFTDEITTGADGAFAFDDVPARAMTLRLSPSSCLSDTQISVTVPANDTLRKDVTLAPDLSEGCMPIPFAGAARMEIEPSSNQAVLLYNTQVHANPAIVVVDLATGIVKTEEFTDITDAFDLALVSSDVIVFNCLKTGDGYYLRFWNIATMTSYRGDVQYALYRGAPPVIDDQFGHLVVTPNGTDVFVTHRQRQGTNYNGQIYCINIAQGVLFDADNDVPNGNFAFDSNLVGSSVNWPYGAAIDPATNELLVSNFRDSVIVAINIAQWGSFDRDSNLTAPIPGAVRKIAASSGVAGFRPWFWDFSGGTGVAAHPSFGIAGYQSGGTASTVSLPTPGMSLPFSTHHLTIHPPRETWYTIIDDASRPQSVRFSVEERSLSTLNRLRRFETRFAEIPELMPLAFAVNRATNILYVAYSNRAIIEVFPLTQSN